MYSCVKLKTYNTAMDKFLDFNLSAHNFCEA